VAEWKLLLTKVQGKYMKKTLLIFPIMFLLVCQCFSQEMKFQEKINNEIYSVFKIKIAEYGDRTFSYYFVDTLDQNHFLHSFVKENSLVLDYLLQNQLEINQDSLNSLIDNKEKASKYFQSSLSSNTHLIENFILLASNYLQKEEQTPLYKDSVMVSDIAILAVRIFYPRAITEEGEVKTKVCVGINGLKDYGEKRNYLLEAFAFSVIFRPMKTKDFELYNEYKKVLNRIEKMNFSQDKEIELHRIQGAVWAILSESELLKKAINIEYEKKKSYLPFYVL